MLWVLSAVLIWQAAAEARVPALIGALQGQGPPVFLVADGTTVSFTRPTGEIVRAFDNIRIADTDLSGRALLITETRWAVLTPDGEGTWHDLEHPHPMLSMIMQTIRMDVMIGDIILLPERIPRILNRATGQFISGAQLYGAEENRLVFRDLATACPVSGWLWLRDEHGLLPVRLTTMKPEEPVIETHRQLESAFSDGENVVLWTSGGERITVDQKTGLEQERVRQESDKQSAVFAFRDPSGKLIPVRIELLDEGVFDALRSFREGRMKARLSVGKRGAEKADWTFSFSVSNPGEFAFDVAMQDEALLLHFQEKNLIVFRNVAGFQLVELKPTESVAVVGGRLYTWKDGRIRQHGNHPEP